MLRQGHIARPNVDGPNSSLVRKINSEKGLAAMNNAVLSAMMARTAQNLPFELSTSAAELRDKANMSLQRMHLSIPPSFAASIGLGTVTLSLAAVSTSQLQPPAVDAMFFLTSGMNGPSDYLSSYKDFDDNNGVRALVQQQFAYRLFARGVRLHIEAVAAGQSFDLHGWLKAKSYDPFTPAKLPTYSFDAKGLYTIAVVNTAGISDKDRFEAASNSLVELIAEKQEYYGRQWVRDNWQVINDEWLDALIENEILAEDDWTTRQLKEGYCRLHWDERKSWLSSKSRSPLTYYVEHDARRGHSLLPEDVPKLAARAKRIILQPLDLDDILVLINSKLSEKDRAASLEDRMPGITAGLSAKGPAQTPRLGSVAQVVSALAGSLDLQRQYDDAARLTGHSTPGCAAMVPDYFGRRKSGHPTVALLLFTAAHLTRCGAKGVVKQLPLHLVKLGAELHQLIAEECPGDFKAEKLAAATSNFWSKPKANISQVRVSYPRGPYHFRDLSKAVSANGNGDGSSRDGTPEEPSQDDRGSPAAAYSELEAGRRDVRTMSLERQEELIACFQRVVKMMKSAFSTAADFPVNEDGMPVAFLPDSIKTLELLELAQARWTGAQDECDAL
ncbi:hypothetical protein BDZ90DRAFT_227579 [Jaminaea rosea]|uniref:Uncharacterized protein n=1 Tax=Jaminaea rosea TaxID=1569628 RepID=A0A316USJ8_9BASI|nr:hypothetical protein BDZ90DRAFT_227579 [Jaminaea rosea]PWN26853.1 hypothetical protein BDZ90DRAFT_227579 [Jaminaea rosea]